MRKTILYIAQSLDGYIAGKNDELDWLTGHESADNASDHGYGKLYGRIDTILMGRRTYELITSTLSPGLWPYPGRKTYVLTHDRSLISNDAEIEFFHEGLPTLLESLKKEEGRDIWLLGGAYLAREAFELEAVDELQIAIIPTLLGEGIPLFPQTSKRRTLRLTSLEEGNGIVLLTYTRREDSALIQTGNHDS